MGSTPSSRMVPHCDPTPGSPSQTMFSNTSLSPPTPTQPSPHAGAANLSLSAAGGDENFEMNEVCGNDDLIEVRLVKIEFFNGLKVKYG